MRLQTLSQQDSLNTLTFMLILYYIVNQSLQLTFMKYLQRIRLIWFKIQHLEISLDSLLCSKKMVKEGLHINRLIMPHSTESSAFHKPRVHWSLYYPRYNASSSIFLSIFHVGFSKALMSCKIQPLLCSIVKSFEGEDMSAPLSMCSFLNKLMNTIAPSRKNCLLLLNNRSTLGAPNISFERTVNLAVQVRPGGNLPLTGFGILWPAAQLGR